MTLDLRQIVITELLAECVVIADISLPSDHS